MLRTRDSRHWTAVIVSDIKCAARAKYKAEKKTPETRRSVLCAACAISRLERSRKVVVSSNARGKSRDRGKSSAALGGTFNDRDVLAFVIRALQIAHDRKQMVPRMSRPCPGPPLPPRSSALAFNCLPRDKTFVPRRARGFEFYALVRCDLIRRFSEETSCY